MKVQKQSDGIRFIVRSPKAATYDFGELFNSEKAWSNCVSFHNDTILDKPRREPTPRQVTRSLRRMNSDPLRMSIMFDAGDSGLVEKWPLKGDRRRDDALLSRSASAPVEKEDIDIVKESISQESLDMSTASQRKSSLKNQWSSVMEDSASYTETAVEKQELPCSLESFFELFVANDAKYSVPKFMEESGDEELHCSPWVDDPDGVKKTRTIEYNHPINAPMAPPMAGARKEQIYKTFGKHGMVLETRTYVSDVPMTDCFYVRDQILVEPIDDNMVSITMSFDLEFVKSTMFRSIIMRTTKGEFENFMQRLASFISKSLGQASSVAPPPPKAPTPTLPLSPVSAVIPKFVAAVLCTVLILQIWIIMDIRSMKVALYQIQSSTSTQCIAPTGIGGRG